MSSSSKEDLAQLRLTPQYIVDLIYDTLECLHRVLTKNSILYVIFGGTALGAQRHSGLIPWDDDADLVILADDEQRFLINDTGSRYEYTTEDARKEWPQESLPYGCFDRLIDVPFGHLARTQAFLL